MNIFCSNLPNDQDMIRALGSVAVPCYRLSVDCAFWGRGDNDTVVRVGIERKKIGDLASCIGDGRYLQQVQTAKDDSIDVLVLVVEGRIHCSAENGLLEIIVWKISSHTGKRAEFYEPVRPNITYSRFTQFLYEVEYLLGIQVMRTENVRETASVIQALYNFHQKPPDEHQSVKTIYKRPIPDTVLLTRPSLIRRISSELDGIGWKKSRDVAEHFGSVLEMMLASEDEWQTIPGIGKVLSGRVVNSIRNSRKIT